jgi:hypothetical protein
MAKNLKVGKREFIQHTSKYLKLAENKGVTLFITQYGKQVLCISLIEKKTIKDLAGLVPHVKVKGDINEHVLPEIDQW